MNKNTSINLEMNNGKLIPTESMSQSSDIFIRNLYKIATDRRMVYLDVSTSHKYIDKNGNIKIATFEYAPYDYNDTNDYECYRQQDGTYPANNRPLGNHIVGNLGVTLVPDANASKKSIDSNVYVIINALGNLNQRTVGIAHEFGHVLLFIAGKPYRHAEPGVDSYIYRSTSIIAKRLGYDN